MVYHSTWAPGLTTACGCAILPLTTQTRGPATVSEGPDIVDEAINFFRANVLFRNFDVKGASDKLLIYITMYIQQCLRRLVGGWGLGDACKTREEAAKALYTLAGEKIALPGEAGFPLGGLLSAPASGEEADLFRGYIRQCREEVGRRIIDRCFPEDSPPNKHWLAFSHRRFMGKTL